MQTKFYKIPRKHLLYEKGPTQAIYFQIQTTGFMPNRHAVYMVNCIYFDGQFWNLAQWLADKLSEEKEVLLCFFALLKDNPLILGYNSRRFALNFLRKRADRLGLDPSVLQIPHVDLMQELKRLQFVHGFTSYSLKNIAHNLNFDCRDPYSAEDAMMLYQDYQDHSEESYQKALFLHGHDLVYFLPAIHGAIETWDKATRFGYKGSDFQILSCGFDGDYLVVEVKSSLVLNEGVHYFDDAQLHLSANQFRLLYPVKQMLFDAETPCAFISKDLVKASTVGDNHGFPLSLWPIAKGRRFYLVQIILLIKELLSLINIFR